MDDTIEGIILLLFIHALVLLLFFGPEDSKPAMPAPTTAAAPAPSWHQVSDYAARLEAKAATAEQYFQ